MIIPFPWRNTRRALGGLFLLALILRLALGLQYYKISPDGVYYAEIGEYLYQNHQYGSNLPGYPAIIQPPLYPTLIAAFRHLFPRHLAGRLVSILTGSLLVLVAYGLGRSLFSASVGWWAAWLLAVHPFFLEYSVKFLTEMTYLLWAGLAALFWIAYRRKSHGKWLVLTAGMLALAYLTRIEGLALWVVFGAMLLGRTILRKSPPPHLLLFSILLLGTFWGYAAWASLHFGERLWIPKLRLIEGHRKLFRFYSRTDPAFRDRTFTQKQNQMMYSLSRDKTNLASYDYFFHGRLPLPRGEEVQPAGASGSIHPFWKTAKIVRSNMAKVARIFVVRNALPFLLVGFLILGLVLSIRHKKWSANAVLLALWIAFGYFLLSHVERRFLLGWSLVFLFWTAYGVEQAYRYGIRRWANRQRVVQVGLVALLMLLLLPYHIRLLSKLMNENYIYRFTQEISRRIAPGSRVVSSRAMVAFYNRYEFYRLPYATADELREYLNKNRVEFLMIEIPRDVRLMPYLKEILRPEVQHRLQLSLVYNKVFNDQRFLVFKIEPQQS